MKKRRRLLLPFAIILSFILISCASTKVTPEDIKGTSTWESDQYAGGYIEKVLIVGVSKDIDKRKLFEKEFARQLGINAVASVDVIPLDSELNKDVIKRAAEKIDADTVLVTHLVKSGETDVYSIPTTKYVPKTSEYHLGPYYLQTYEQESSPTDYSRYQAVRLKSNLYERETEKLIWSATSIAAFGGAKRKSVEYKVKFLCEIIIKKMRNKGLIK